MSNNIHEEDKINDEIKEYCDTEEINSIGNISGLQELKDKLYMEEVNNNNDEVEQPYTLEQMINQYLYSDKTSIHDDVEEEDIIIPDKKKKEKKKVVIFDKDNLSSFEKMLIKNHKGYYKAGKVKNKKDKTKKPNKNKKRKMTDDELVEYYAKKKIEKERKEQLKFLKKFKKETSKSKNKKYSKLEREIEREYFKQKEEEKPKTIDDFLKKRNIEKWKREVGYDYIVNKKFYDAYHNYRKHGNIISVSELEDFKEDYKVSFLKNVEQMVMKKLQEPIDFKVKTRVEYYDKKGNLISEEIMPGGKKKKKKKKDKFSKKELSPDFNRF